MTKSACSFFQRTQSTHGGGGLIPFCDSRSDTLFWPLQPPAHVTYIHIVSYAKTLNLKQINTFLKQKITKNM